MRRPRTMILRGVLMHSVSTAAAWRATPYPCEQVPLPVLSGSKPHCEEVFAAVSFGC